MKIVDGNLMLLIDDVGAMADHINDGAFTGVNLYVVDIPEEKVTEEEVVKAISALGEDFESYDEISGQDFYDLKIGLRDQICAALRKSILATRAEKPTLKGKKQPKVNKTTAAGK